MFIKDSFSKKASSPIKYAEALAMGKPVICNNGVGDMEHNEKNQYGFNLNRMESGEYSVVIEKMLASKFDSSSIRKTSQQFFGLEENISSYLKVYYDLEK